MLAATKGNVEGVRLLLEAHQNQGTLAAAVNAQNNYGNSVLSRMLCNTSVGEEHAEIASLLLEAGARPDSVSNGSNTPLMNVVAQENGGNLNLRIPCAMRR